MARTPITSPGTPASSREDEVLIREIDEAVREDALLDFMRKHGVKVLGGVIALIAALGGYMVWHHFAEQKLETQSETVIAALDLASISVLREFLQDMAEHTSRAWVVADYEADTELPWRSVVAMGS